MKTIAKPTFGLLFTSLILLSMLSTSLDLQAQKDYMFKPKKPEPCGQLMIDLTKGTINGLKPNAEYEAAKQAFPACTAAVGAMERMDDTEEDLASSVGFRFYFDVDILEVRKSVKAKTSRKIWGKKPKVLDALFGEAEFKGDYHRIYKTAYGSLYADLDRRGKIELISMHSTNVEDTWRFLCMDSGHCR